MGKTDVQSILIPKAKFTEDTADIWIKQHGRKLKFGNKSGPDETEEYYRYRQKNPKNEKNIEYRTIDVGSKGIKFIIEIDKKQAKYGKPPSKLNALGK